MKKRYHNYTMTLWFILGASKLPATFLHNSPAVLTVFRMLHNRLKNKTKTVVTQVLFSKDLVGL